MPPTISLIVPVRNGGSDFKRCLAAIQSSAQKPFEFFVVDDGSTDDTPRWAAEAGATVLHTAMAGSGPAIGRNLAAQQATGDILYFCDADVEIRPDTLALIQADFMQDPDLAALFGSYDDQPGHPSFLSQYKNLFHHYVHQHGGEDASTFWSGCGAIRRDLFLKYGGFSSRYELPSIEDIELGYTLKRNGYRIRLDKSLQVKHLKHWTWPSLLHSDIIARGIPWTRLLLREGAFLNDLNLQTHNRVSVVLVYLMVFCLLVGIWQPWAWAALPLGVAGLLYLNRHVYQFFNQQRGVRFTVGVVLMHWLYYLYNGVSFGLGALMHIAEGKPSRSRTGGLSVKRLYAVPMAAVLLFAVLLRFHALGAQSMWLDELLEIGESRNAPSVIVNDLLQFGAMPLDYFVTHVMLYLGQQDFWLRVAPALWSVLTVALIYRLVGRWLGYQAGLLAGLVLTVSAFHVRYAQETRPYALLGLLSVASFYFLLRAIRTNKLKFWAGYTVTTILCLFTHYFTLFLIAAQGLVALVWLVRSPQVQSAWSRLLRFGGAVGLVVLALAVTPTFYNVLDVGRYFAIGLSQPATLTEPAELKPNKAEGPVIDKALLDDQLLQVLSGGGDVWRWVFLALVIGGLAIAAWRWPRLATSLFIWLVVPIGLILLFLIHRGTFFATRYVTPSFFALVILATICLLGIAQGIVGRWPRASWLTWACVILIPSGLSLQRVQAYYATDKEDWRATGQMLAANFRPGDTVDAPLGGAVIFHYAPNALPGRLDSTSLDALSAVNGRLWVLMHPYIGPAEGGLRDWLAAQPSTVEYPIDDSLSLYLVDNASSRTDLLAAIQPLNRPLTLSALADQYAELGDPTQAETDYRQALALSDAPRYKIAYADFLRQAGREDEAAQLYLSALAADSQQPLALSGLGRIYYDRGQFDAAAIALQQALALDPQNYPAAYFLWQSDLQLGRTADADRAHDLAAQLLPDLIVPP